MAQRNQASCLKIPFTILFKWIPVGVLFLWSIDFTNANGCCTFEDSICRLQNISTKGNWKWSKEEKPQDVIPAFKPLFGNYVWMKNASLINEEIGILTAHNITMRNRDTLTAYAFVYTSHSAYTPRIAITFFEDGNSNGVELVSMTENDTWAQLSFTCLEARNLQCCATVCTGRLEISGRIESPEDFLAFDELNMTACEFSYNETTTTTMSSSTLTSTNSTISTMPSTTSTTNFSTTVSPPATTNTSTTMLSISAHPQPILESPSNDTDPHKLLCNFDTSDLCEWSPALLSNGWVWSGHFQNANIPPSPSRTTFIYIQHTAAEAYSPQILNVTPTTTFTFNYFLRTLKTTPPSNGIEIYFQDGGYFTPFTANLASSANWQRFIFQCESCCGGAASCEGRFHIKTFNTVGTELLAAIDDFLINYE